MRLFGGKNLNGKKGENRFAREIFIEKISLFLLQFKEKLINLVIMQDIEIEIQVNIKDSKSLINFLKNNAEFVSRAHQIDEYFSPAHRNFIKTRPVKEWLRLRNSCGKYSINYKNWYFDKKGRSNYCDEYETELENLDQARKILSVLNFNSIVKVNKIRKIWKYKDYEIAIDSVKNLGNFVEIEYIGKSKNTNFKEITREMINFLKKLDCGKIKRNYVGYPFQLLFPEETKYEEQ